MTAIVIMLFLFVSLLAMGQFRLYKSNTQLLDRLTKEERKVRDLEDELIAFLVEMREDNQQLQTRISQFVHRQTAQSMGTGEEVVCSEDVVQPSNTVELKNEVQDATKTVSTAVQSAYTQQHSPINTEANANIAYDADESLINLLDYASEEKDPYDQAKALHASGMSVQEIAKKLGKGHTEIDLMLRIQQ
ncbi:MAG: hypothetical protein ACRC5C_11075 [Bacilli bacterium]